MPAPLGKVPTKRMPEIQVFGRDDSSDTRAALRFFRERRVVVHYVDLRKRPMAAGELRRFTERLGGRALLDETVARLSRAGLAYLSLDDAGIVTRVLADPRLLRLPLVRHGNEVTRRSGRGDLGGLAQALGRAPDGRHAPTTRRPREHDARDRPADVVGHEARPWMTPVPWPIQTSPTRMRTTAMIHRVRMRYLRMAS